MTSLTPDTDGWLDPAIIAKRARIALLSKQDVKIETFLNIQNKTTTKYTQVD